MHCQPFECQVAFVNTTVVMWSRQIDTSGPMCLQNSGSSCTFSDEIVTLICFSPPQPGQIMLHLPTAADIEPIDTGEQVCP